MAEKVTAAESPEKEKGCPRKGAAVAAAVELLEEKMSGAQSATVIATVTEEAIDGDRTY